MAAPYSLDLRRLVARALETGASSIEVGIRFGVSSSFVRKVRIRLREEGTLEARPHAGGPSRCVDAVGERIIEYLSKATPDASLGELCDQYELATRVRISEPSMCRILKRLALSRKKKQ